MRSSPKKMKHRASSERGETRAIEFGVEVTSRNQRVILPGDIRELLNKVTEAQCRSSGDYPPGRNGGNEVAQQRKTG